MEEKKSFVIYNSWARLFMGLPEQEAGLLIKAICAHKLGEEYFFENSIVEAVFNMIVEQIDKDAEKYMKTCERRRKSGAKGGLANAKQKEAIATNCLAKESKNKQKQADTESESESESESDTELPKGVNKEKKNIKKKDQKHKYGEYSHVLLTDREFELLVNDYGQEKTQKLIKCLDEAIEMKGYKYKSCYLAIKKWVVDAVDKQENKKEKGISEMSRREINSSRQSQFEYLMNSIREDMENEQNGSKENNSINYGNIS